jgi:hypothetical protein
MSNNPSTISNFLLYSTEAGKIKIDVFLQDETIWLSQKSMANLFDCSSENIIIHLRNIYKSAELNENRTTKESLVVQKEGNREVSRTITHYNLDAIISVGYRVSSFQATQFRIWATKVLKEYMIKGFALDDERLKQGKKVFGKNYFQELLERIRDIRTSEKNFYESIKDLYATSIDYHESHPQIKQDFFATVQNKIHFGLLGKTAAEIISERAGAKKENMGLTNWNNGPEGKIRKTDILIAKNYLTEKEIKKYNLFVSMLLDHAEFQATEHTQMKMKDWEEVIDSFLKFQKKEVLTTKGGISKSQAENQAIQEFSEFKNLQKSFKLLKK